LPTLATISQSCQRICFTFMICLVKDDKTEN